MKWNQYDCFRWHVTSSAEAKLTFRQQNFYKQMLKYLTLSFQNGEWNHISATLTANPREVSVFTTRSPTVQNYDRDIGWRKTTSVSHVPLGVSIHSVIGMIILRMRTRQSVDNLIKVLMMTAGSWLSFDPDNFWECLRAP